MTVEENKALVHRFVQEVFVDERVESVDELLAEDFVPHNWPYTGDGRADLKAAMARVSAGLADPAWTIDDTIAKDDRVVIRVTASARHVGPFMGMPATNRSYSIGEIHIFRIAGGRIAEHWQQLDGLSMMAQLGLLPGRSPG
jgi:steroid delta-isomerase-like uncharacterized protein